MPVRTTEYVSLEQCVSAAQIQRHDEAVKAMKADGEGVSVHPSVYDSGISQESTTSNNAMDTASELPVGDVL